MYLIEYAVWVRNGLKMPKNDIKNPFTSSLTNGLQPNPICIEIKSFLDSPSPTFNFTRETANYIYAQGLNVRSLLAQAALDSNSQPDIVRLSEISSVMAVGTVNLGKLSKFRIRSNIQISVRILDFL